MSVPSVVAVVPAAGIGSRMQADRPKQYLYLNNKTVIEHTLQLLLSHPNIDRVVVALNPEDDYFHDLPIARAEHLVLVEGGEDRATSVLNGLALLAENEWALVHDAARPCLSHSDIDKLLGCTSDSTICGGILATPVRDTMKRAQNQAPSRISHTESREQLWHALTPQLFRAGQLQQAIVQGQADGVNITDEASAMEAQGHNVALVTGNPANIKITHPDDMPLAAFYLSHLAEASCA